MLLEHSHVVTGRSRNRMSSKASLKQHRPDRCSNLCMHTGAVCGVQQQAREEADRKVADICGLLWQPLVHGSCDSQSAGLPLVLDSCKGGA